MDIFAVLFDSFLKQITFEEIMLHFWITWPSPGCIQRPGYPRKTNLSLGHEQTFRCEVPSYMIQLFRIAHQVFCCVPSFGMKLYFPDCAQVAGRVHVYPKYQIKSFL